MPISLNHLVFDSTELERLGAADIKTLEELNTICLVRNHPWDLQFKVIRRQNPFKPGPNIYWQDQVLAAADSLMGLILRDHLEEGIVNFPITVALPEPCTITFEIKLVAHLERDVRLQPPLSPAPAPAPQPPRAPAPPQANNTYRPPVNAQRPQNQLRRP